MSTVRVAQRRNFTRIDARTLADSRLSYRARGVLAFLLSKPDHWEFTAESVADAGPEGRDAIRSVFKELETHGYLVRRRWREGGRFVTEALLYEHPDDAPKPPLETASPEREISAGSLAPVSQALLVTTESNDGKSLDAPSSRPHQGDARQIANAVWEERSPKPTLAGGWVSLARMAERFLVAGWPTDAVHGALLSTPTFTDNAVTYALNGGGTNGHRNGYVSNAALFQASCAAEATPPMILTSATEIR
jgi:hypothetical protein